MEIIEHRPDDGQLLGGRSEASSFPCLYRNNSNEIEPEIALSPNQDEASGDFSSDRLSTAQKKSAIALAWNVEYFTERYGLENIGFLTLTFRQNITDAKEAQRRLNSLFTGVMKKRYSAYMRVFERCKSGRIHFHLLVALGEDIRTGFDFSQVKNQNYKSANSFLRKEWAFWRKTAPKYGFGRTELLPIQSTSEGIGKYVGKYISKNVQNRPDEDKGIRLVSYSKNAKMANTRFQIVSDGSAQWRKKVAIFSEMLGRGKRPVPYEDMSKFLGKNWCFKWREIILNIPIKE